MVNYYETLKVSTKASKTEIKSAYRRLARKLHPDKNNGSEQTAIAFAQIAEAYEILGNPKQRSAYDKKLNAVHVTNGNGDSVFASANSHAQRWRQMIYEHRYNEIIDRMIAEERKEIQTPLRVSPVGGPRERAHENQAVPYRVGSAPRPFAAPGPRRAAGPAERCGPGRGHPSRRH